MENYRLLKLVRAFKPIKTNMNAEFATDIPITSYASDFLTKRIISLPTTTLDETVTSLSRFFYGYSNLKTIDVTNWNTENITNFENLCRKL